MSRFCALRKIEVRVSPELLREKQRISGATNSSMEDESHCEAEDIIARSKLWTPSLQRLLRRWYDNIGCRIQGHKQSETFYNFVNYAISIPSSILLAVVTTGVLTSFQNCDNPLDTKCERYVNIRIAMGVLAGVSGVLTVMSPIINASGMKEAHKSAVSSYEEIRRRIDAVLSLPPITRGDPSMVITEIENKFDTIGRDAPRIGQKYNSELTEYAIAQRSRSDSDGLPVIGVVERSGGSRLQRKKRIPDTEKLAKLLVDHIEPQQPSSPSSDPDVEEGVTLNFDPSGILPGVSIEEQRRQHLQRSLARALKFELERLGADE